MTFKLYFKRLIIFLDIIHANKVIKYIIYK